MIQTADELVRTPLLTHEVGSAPPRKVPVGTGTG